MSKIVFSKNKGFTRDEANDYIDNGDIFHLYTYKNVLPVEKLVFGGYKNNCYISIRLDLVGILEGAYKEDMDLLNMYNGINKNHYSESDFFKICNKIINKYNLTKNLCKPSI